MTERRDKSEAERVAAQRAATDHIFRLMRGDGNQSRINDGQPSASQCAMTIEDVAEKADAWSEAIKKIIKSVMATAVALATAIGALLMWWPFGGNTTPVGEPLLQDTGYGPQCSQLYNTIDHTWTEQQWVVWEGLKRDMDC